MGHRTPLYDRHVEAGARIVDFGGWDMPLHYGSQIDEHHVVRDSAGCFDVSHMAVVDVEGADAKAWLRILLANDVARLAADGAGLYTTMLLDDGGIVDDLIVYRQRSDAYRLVVNAATCETDLAWMQSRLGDYRVELADRQDLAMIAVQGPDATGLSAPTFGGALAEVSVALKPFHATWEDRLFVARTGYTGEDGFEIICPADDVVGVWDRLVAVGVVPCGLGARDTLRLEAGLNLYGQDMDRSVSPLECGLGWTVSWKDEGRDFAGRSALAAKRETPLAEFAGLVLEGRGVMRHGQRVSTEAGDGIVTSGSFSPTMSRSIALARLPAGAGSSVEIDIRSKLVPARRVKPPFVRHGRILVEL